MTYLNFATQKHKALICQSNIIVTTATTREAEQYLANSSVLFSPYGVRKCIIARRLFLPDRGVSLPRKNNQNRTQFFSQSSAGWSGKKGFPFTIQSSLPRTTSPTRPSLSSQRLAKAITATPFPSTMYRVTLRRSTKSSRRSIVYSTTKYARIPSWMSHVATPRKYKTTTFVVTLDRPSSSSSSSVSCVLVRSPSLFYRLTPFRLWAYSTT